MWRALGENYLKIRKTKEASEVRLSSSCRSCGVPALHHALDTCPPFPPFPASQSASAGCWSLMAPMQICCGALARFSPTASTRKRQLWYARAVAATTAMFVAHGC